MKKTTKITLGAIAAVSALYVGGIAPIAMPSGVVSSAYAASTGDPTVIDAYGDLRLVSYEDAFTTNFKPTVKIDEEHNIYDIYFDVSLTNLEKLLDQTPGPNNGVIPGYFFLGISMDGWKDINHKIEQASNTTKLDATFSELMAASTDEKIVWKAGAQFEYFDSSDSTWKALNGTADGETTIKQNLKTTLGESTELVYGKNWRIRYNYSNTNQVFKWTAVGDSKDSAYVIVRFGSQLPTGGNNTDDRVVYATLAEALSDETKSTVFLNKSTTIDSTLEVPSGKTIKLANEDVTLTLGAAGKISGAKGCIKNSDGESLFNEVTESWTDPISNVSSNISKKLYLGQEIEITAPDYLEKGYVRTTTITDNAGNTINADEKTGKYIMSALANITDITISHVYKAVESTILVEKPEEDDEATVTTDYDNLAGEIAESFNGAEIQNFISEHGSTAIKIGFEVDEDLEADDDFVEAIGATAARKLDKELAKLGTSLEEVKVYDIKLRVYDADDATKNAELHELEGDGVTVAIALPDTDHDYYVIRIHNGKVEIVATPDDVEENQIVFKNNKFSYFALAGVAKTVTPPEDEESTPEQPTPENPTPENPTPDDTPAVELPPIKLPEPTVEEAPETGFFTNTEKSSTENNSASIVAAIAGVVAVATAAIAKLFKKGEQEQ